MNEVFVIHKDGKQWAKDGRKIAYLKSGSAKGVITSECDKYASDKTYAEYDSTCFGEGKELYDKLFEEERKRYEIIVYVPSTAQ